LVEQKGIDMAALMGDEKAALLVEQKGIDMAVYLVDMLDVLKAVCLVF
jgi:hypothetical protein